MKKFLVMFLCLFMIIALVGCGSGTETDDDSDKVIPDHWPESILFASGPSGGGWYTVGAALGNILMQEIPGLTVTVVEGGGTSNVRDIQSGEAHISLTFTNAFMQGLLGQHPFTPGEIDENVQGLATLWTSNYQGVVLKDSDIYTFEDLAGKRILPGEVGWSSEIMTALVLEQYGLSYEDMGSVSYTGYSDVVQLMRDGHGDAGFCLMNYPVSWIMDLGTTHELRMITPSREVIDSIIDMNPGYGVGEIPAGAYDWLEETHETVVTYSMLILSNDIPEDMAYRIVEILMDEKHRDTLYQAHPDMRGFDEVIAEGLKALPIHPGVEKYYKEKGIID